MLRILMATIAVAAFVLPAAAYDTTWDFPVAGTDENENIYIYLSLDCYIQIDWQDMEINFGEDPDWWCEYLENTAYSALTGANPEPDGQEPTWPWAGDHWYAPSGLYYESGDGADIYVNSNNPLSMMVHTNGNLTATDPTCGECEIPTWFTLCLAPFYVGGVQIVTDPDIPQNGPGSYVHDAGGGLFGYGNDPGDTWPFQEVFACDPPSQSWTLGPLCPGVSGTMKFLARIHRNGMLDAGGDYSTFLDVHFGSPTVP